MPLVHPAYWIFLRLYIRLNNFFQDNRKVRKSISITPESGTAKRAMHNFFILAFCFVAATATTVPEAFSSGECMAETVTTVCTKTRTMKEKIEEENKALALSLMQEVFGDKNIDALDKYVDETYIQHNPLAADGRTAVKEFLRPLFKDQPKNKVQIQRIAADGDLVFVHWRDDVLFGKTTSFVEMWKVKNGKFLEHWDVIQFMPEKSLNDHPLF